ncbi:PEP-CTERM sorting domain-containing protein [Pseudoduganella umbonata]|nr:PEP-CTERM sorting domain-containing protein [Pseudoduganella umbonata]MBB3223212.1 hypothetical protein [Pseudoduganella umbonata]
MKSLFKSIHCNCVLAAFAMVLTAAPHAHAAVAQGAATISNLRYALTDLDPDDGISPNLAFNPVYGNIWGGLNFSGSRVYEDNDFIPPSISGNWENGNNAISSRVDGSGRFEDTVLSVSHRSETVTTEAHAFIDFQFYLTPGTRITFYSDYALGASGYDPDGRARSLTFFQGRLSEFGTGEVRNFLHFAGDENLELNGTASISWDNAGPEAWEGSLNLHTFGYSVGSAVPVPEPSSYAMLAAGLGLMGFLARQRTRRARQSGRD